MNENYFVELNKINVNDKTEKKNGLTYLSWAWAWGELKKLHPKAFYTIYETENGAIYHTDGKTCWVKTGVTVDGLEHIEYLPVMDYRNNSISAEKVTSVDVNKAIQRSLTKAVARHGLGLYIYAGEDLPENNGGSKATREQLVFVAENCTLEEIEKLRKSKNVASLEELSEAEMSKIIKALQKRKEAGEE